MPRRRVIIFLFLLLGLLAAGCLPGVTAKPTLLSSEPQTCCDYLKAGPAEQELFAVLRQALQGKAKLALPADLELPFNSAYSQCYLTLIQRGCHPLRWGARKEDLSSTLERLVSKLRSLPRFSNFSVNDPNRCRLLFEIVTSEKKLDFPALEDNVLGENRFEPGISGLKLSSINNGLRYFMPSDAISHSILSVKQLNRYLERLIGVERKSQVSPRHLAENLSQCRKISSQAWLTCGTAVLPLYRGLPEPRELDRQGLYQSIRGGLDWLSNNLDDKGRFLYYYDGIKDSDIDFMHPHNPTYYNILRHSGGTIALLVGYELSGQRSYLELARRSLDFFIATLRTRKDLENEVCYPWFNRKAKLGGAGIGLAALVKYTELSGDRRYQKTMAALVRHLLSQIAADGEMIGYYLHPRHNHGLPIVNPSSDMREKLFSFYYPGEALLGLALYYRRIESGDLALKKEMYDKSRLALDFIIHIRPQKYAHLFQSLPADAWLMQAIEEWQKVSGFCRPADIDFVFGDADLMLSHMYKPGNALYPDYSGGFYYNYGDHVYHDASRCEGLIAAYYLARNLAEHERADNYLEHLQLAANGLMRLRNTPASAWAHLFPEKAAGSFRFKLTRAWIRVDSVQHSVCFLARLYRAKLKEIQSSEKTD